MIKFAVTEQNVIEHNPNWPKVSDHLYRILITDGPRSRKTKTLINLINNQPDVDKIHFYARDLYKAKCQLLVKKAESVELKHCNDQNTDECNANRKRKILTVFDDMVANKFCIYIYIYIYIRYKIPNIREPEQFAINHGQILSLYYLKLYKIGNLHPYFFYCTTITFMGFRWNLLKRI